MEQEKPEFPQSVPESKPKRRRRGHDNRPLTNVGVVNLRRMISSLIRSLNEPGISASMKLRVIAQVNQLRKDLDKVRLEQARRRADEILANPPSEPLIEEPEPDKPRPKIKGPFQPPSR